MYCNTMEFEDCGDCDEAELWGLINQHHDKAKQNSDAVKWCIANVKGFEYSSITIMGLMDIANLHHESARYLTKLAHLVKAIKGGYAIFIKCPVCKSCVVDLGFNNNGVINQSCVNCGYVWDFPL